MTQQMHTLATLLEPGLEGAGRGSDGILVGRRVANEAFVTALVRYADVARFVFFVGEEAQRPAVASFIETLSAWDPQRIEVAHRLELPDRLARGDISVLHHESHWGWFFDLLALRDVFAQQHVPVTGQIHSLSYPRMLESYWRGQLSPPGAGDAIFCSTTSGRRALEASFDLVAQTGADRGWPTATLQCERPVIPLGIDVDALIASAHQHPRNSLRQRLAIAPDALVLMVMGRLSEYDKMDLFPLIRVFSWLVQAGLQRDLQLIVAGARQGTGTADMVKLWATALGVGDRVHLVLDFPASEKGGWLAAADVFISPSDNVQETFGLSVIEAMAVGAAVVVSDFDGYRETVPPEVGWRVKTEAVGDLSALRLFGLSLFERPLHLLLGQSVSVSPRELLFTLMEVCRNEASRITRGQAADRWARATYDWAHVIPRYEAVWNQLKFHPKRPAFGLPLGMDYPQVFAGHFAARAPSEGPLRQLGDHPVPVYVHAELKSLFNEAHVQHALALIQTERLSRPQLRSRLQAECFEPGLRGKVASEILVAWLLKHGLVAE